MRSAGEAPQPRQYFAAADLMPAAQQPFSDQNTQHMPEFALGQENRPEAKPTIVYHMLPQAEWEAVPTDGEYRAGTLASEGFVHCTAEGPILQTVANRFYRSEAGDWLILAVDLSRLDPAAAPVRWEAADGHLFPHIYGPIARKAVIQVLPFPRRADGSYQLPEALP